MERAEFNKKLSGAKCVDMSKVNFRGNIMEGAGMELLVTSCWEDPSIVNKSICADKDKIEEVAPEIVFVTFASLNFFDSDNYTDPIGAVVG